MQFKRAIILSICLGFILNFQVPDAVAETTQSTPSLPPVDHSGKSQTGIASYYGSAFTGKPMADGKAFDPQGHSAASKTLPIGTVAKVTNLSNGKASTVTVEDRGPYVPGRVVDVTEKTAAKLGMKKDGVDPVKVEPVAIPQADGSVKPGPAIAKVSPDSVPPDQRKVIEEAQKN